MKLTAKQAEVDNVFKPNQSDYSDWVKRKVIDSNNVLKWGNNGTCRHGVFFGDNRYIWEKQGARKIVALRTIGFNEKSKASLSRPIRKDIDAFFKKQRCVICGCNSDLTTDHKNDLYNDWRVLDSKTQILDDFQCLCRHCNLQKRQINKEEKRNRKVFSAKSLSRFKFYEFEFPWEKKVFDECSVDCKLDTYWYDPVEFEYKIHLYNLYRIPINKMVKQNIKLVQ